MFNRSEFRTAARAEITAYAEVFGFAPSVAMRKSLIRNVAARLAPPVVEAPRAAEIRAELQAMDLSDAPMNWAHRRDLAAELATLR